MAPQRAREVERCWIDSRVVSRVSAIVVAAASASLGGQGAAAETLANALATAYRYNPQIDAERARLRATDEGVARAMSSFRPDFTAQVDVGVQRQNTVPSSPADGRSRPRGYQLNFVQPLFTGFQATNAVNEAEANVRAGQQTLRNVEQTVLQAVVTAYMDVVRDTALLRLRENNLDFLSKELRATQDRFEVGEVTRTDVAQARARRSAAVSDISLAKANLKSSRARFERLVGRPPGRLHAPPLPRHVLPKSLREAVEIALQQNPAVVAALYQEQSAKYAVDRITGELSPTVQLEATYQKRRDPSPLTESSETGAVTARMQIPFYRGGDTHARVRQAKHTHVSRIQEIEQARTEAREQATSAWSLFQASQAQLQSDQAQVDAQQIALQGVQEEERVGQRTLLDVLDAQQELLNAQVTLTSTRRDIIVNAYAVLSAIGRLDGAQYSVAATVYDPDVHYHEVRRKWFGISITRDADRDRRHERGNGWGYTIIRPDRRTVQ